MAPGVSAAIGGVGENDADSVKSMKLAFELGVNFVDTAPNYGNGHSEELVGRAVREWPDRIYVGTKVNPKNFTWPLGPRRLSEGRISQRLDH